MQENFFRHDHIIESYYKALGKKIDTDERFRAGVPRELISGNGNQVVWKQNMKTMMHDLVDSMFDETDLYDNIQKIIPWNTDASKCTDLSNDN